MQPGAGRVTDGAAGERRPPAPGPEAASRARPGSRAGLCQEHRQEGACAPGGLRVEAANPAPSCSLAFGTWF